ncbi:MAG: diguanylate cyclase [Fimbriimonadales bacterium]
MRAFWRPILPAGQEDPRRLAELAWPALSLALEAIEGAAKLTVSPGSPEAAEFRRRMLAYGAELAQRDPHAGRLQKIREQIGEELESFGETQRQQVEDFVLEVRDSLRGLVAALRATLDPADELAEGMERMQRHLAFASECDDLRELKRVVREQAETAKRALDRFAEQQRQSEQQLETNLGSLQEKLEQAEIASQTDHLTHLANRAALDYYLEAILQKAKLGVGRYSLAVLDLDDFGSINDAHGHAAGDQALNAFAGKLKLFLGPGAFVSRFGGDEFAIVAAMAPQSLKRRLDDLQRNLQGSQVLVESAGRRVTVRLGMSAGITPIDPSDTRDLLLQRADAELREAKRSGKGRASIRSIAA